MSETINTYLSTPITVTSSNVVVTSTGDTSGYAPAGTYGISAGLFAPGSLGSVTINNAGYSSSNGSGGIYGHQSKAPNTTVLGILLGHTGTIINTGAIGGNSGIGILGTVGSSYINNSNHIYAVYGDGIYLQGDGRIVNTGNIFKVSPINIPQYKSIGTAIELKSGGTITNTGAGFINGGANGIVLDNGGTITNTSIPGIKGNYRAGIYDSAGSVLITNSGDIKGATDGIILKGAGTIINAGGITGGTSDAISFASGFANKLILESGTNIVGLVDGGNSIGSSIASTLELAGPGGTYVTGIGSQYINFATIVNDANANWIIGGSNTLVSGATLDNLGTLAINGSFVNNGIVLTGSSPLTVGAAVYGTGVFELGANANVTFTSTAASSQTVELLSPTANVVVDNAFQGKIIAAFVHTLSTQFTQFFATETIIASGGIGTYLINNGTGTLVPQTLSAAVFGPSTLNNPTLLNQGFIDANGPASLGGFDLGILLGSTGSIINTGTIKGQTGIGMVGTLGSNYIYNSNLIYGTYGSGIYLHNTGSIVNNGIIFGKNTLNIHGGDTGIELFSGGTVINRTSGTIASHSNYAVDSNGPVSVLNAGLITGNSGINSNGTAFVSNASTGTINVYRTGIELKAGGIIINAGAIQATGTQGVQNYYNGIYLQNGGTVLNHGSITGLTGIKIQGTSPTTGYLQNSGIIDGFGNTASLNRLQNNFGSYDVGVVFNIGGSISNSAMILGGHGGVVFNNNIGTATGTVNNTGTILSGGGYGVGLETGGAVNNSGMISGYRAGIRADNAITTIVNTGIILGTGNTFATNGTLSAKNLGIGTYVSHGIQLTAGGTILNDATGTISAVQAINISGVSSGYVYNAGLIDATKRSGVNLKDYGTINNHGTIFANHAGVQLYNGGYVKNSGQITSLNKVGIYLYNNGYVTNSGTITANYAGIYSRNGSYTKTYIRNSGQITSHTSTAVYLKASGQVYNSGKINAAAGAGVFITNGMLTNGFPGTITGASGVALGVGNMTNHGKVDGTLGAGIYLQGLGTVRNSSAGQVIGAKYGVGLGILSSYLANFGTITGANGVGFKNGGYVINSGTITGLTANGIYEAAGSGSITNNAAGKLIGHTDGIRLLGAGNVTNLGLVRGSVDSGILLAGGGSVNNSGSIIGVYQGVHLKNFAGYIKNTGLIASIGSIFTSGTPAVSNQNYGVQISAGGTLVNAAGGTIESRLTGVYTSGIATIVNAGTIIGSSADAINMTGGGKLIIDPTASFIGTVTGGNTANLELSGTNAATLTGIGTQFVGFNTITVDAGSAWTLTGNNTIAAGQTLNDFATLIVNGSFVDNGVVNADPSTIMYDSAVTGTGTIDIGAGSTVIFNASVASSITIDFLSTTGTIIENAPLLFNNPTIVGTGTIIIACFAKGTRILTPRGEIAVETLREGDLVITAEGEDAPIKWIGTRKLDLRRHAHPQKAQPIRISAGAISHNVPSRDLFLSPDHALYLHDHLVPAKALVNRMSVTQENWQSVSYYHIELDQHAVIFAEGTPVETYLETGNRDCFENANLPMALHPDFGQDFQAMREAQSCAPFLDDDGPIIRRLRTAMLDRAYLNPQRRAVNA